MSVYVIECAGLLKIGYSENPERRTANLFKSTSRYAAPRAAYVARGTQRLAYVIPDATKSDEAAIHDALRHYAIGCEWFVDEADLWDVIYTFLPGDLPSLAIRPDGPVWDTFPEADRGGRNVGPALALLDKRRNPLRRRSWALTSPPWMTAQLRASRSCGSTPTDGTRTNP